MDMDMDMDSSLLVSSTSAQTQPIAISTARRPTVTKRDVVTPSHTPDLYDQALQAAPTSRRRRAEQAAPHFRGVQWEEQHDQSQPHVRSPPSPQRSSSSTSSSSSSKTKSQKDNGLFRRTSLSCRNKFQKAINNGKTPRGANAGEPIEPGDFVLQPRMAQPLAPDTQHHRSLRDRLGRPNKLLSNVKQSRYDTPHPSTGHGGAAAAAAAAVAPPASTPMLPIAPPSHAAALLQQSLQKLQHQKAQLDHVAPSSHLPHEPRGGSAARRAAAATANNSFTNSTIHFPPFDGRLINEVLHAQSHPHVSTQKSFYEIKEQNRLRLGSNSSAADSGADLGCSSDVDMPDAEPNVKLDPLQYLPVELTTLVFSYLDADSLKACQQIGPWKALASDPLIWRGEYLRNFQRETHVTPVPIQIGGVGVGKPNDPRQDWELMHLAREQIDANWKAGRGRAVYMAGHTDSVYCVQFDEQKIITGSRDRTIRVWDVNTHRCIKVIGGPSVRPIPGPRVLRTVDYPSFHHAEASVNGTAYGHRIYHTPSDFHSASILCLQYDDDILVTGSSDNDLIVWNVHTYEPIQRLRQHQGGVLDVAFDAEHIVSCSKDCTIVVWDRKTLKPRQVLTGHNGPVNAVQLRGHLLVSASGDGVARLWDLRKMTCVREFPAKERGLAAVEFSDDARFVLAGGNDHVTYKFEVATGAEVLQYAGHSQLVRSLFLDTQNRRVVSGSYDLDLRVYDYESGKLVAVFPEWTTSWMLAAKCDYRRIVSTSQDGRILLIDFGINQDGAKVPGVDLLRGVEPWSTADAH